MRCKLIAFLFLVLVLPACFLASEYTSSQFNYTQNGRALTISLQVPKGYLRQERIDTAGALLQVFRYPGGAYLYAAFVADTTVQLQAFNRLLHQPRQEWGGLVYKGEDSTEHFYREIRQGHLRFGYHSVSREAERLFDSATNFAALHGR